MKFPIHNYIKISFSMIVHDENHLFHMDLLIILNAQGTC